MKIFKSLNKSYQIKDIYLTKLNQLTKNVMDKKIINKNPRKFRPEKSNSNFRFPHVVNEEKKEVWVYIASGFPTISCFSSNENQLSRYKSCLCNKDTFINLGGKL